jgi:RNA polymerase sigma-70 factor, ECF subfamily
VHAAAASFGATDTARLVSLYDTLLQVNPSPVIALNRAIAIGMRDGAAAGLDAVEAVAGDLPDYPLVPAARADFLRRDGRWAAAAAAYAEAIAASASDAERRYLAKRLAEVEAFTNKGDSDVYK